MVEEDKNIFNDPSSLKEMNPWIVVFDLTDEEVIGVVKLISRLILGSIEFDDFFPQLKKIVKKDDNIIKQLAISAAEHRLLPIEDQLDGVDVKGFIKNLKGEEKSEQEKPPTPLKQAPQTPKSLAPQVSISFSTEDDEEIDKIISSLSPGSNNHDYYAIADAIISEFGYNTIESGDMVARLKSVVVSRLKDIRDEIETVENLKKGKEVGGLGLSDDQIKALMTIVSNKMKGGIAKKEQVEEKSLLFPARKPDKKEKTTISEKRRVDTEVIQREIEKIKPVKKEPVVDLGETPQISEEDGLPVIKSPMGDDLMILSKKDTKTQKPSGELGQFPKKDILAPTSQPIQNKEIKNPVIPAHIEEKTQVVTKPQPFPRSQSQKEQLPAPKAVKSAKPMVDGIKVEPTLVGPVEELATMTLINFRRLGETPHQAIAKIEEKINLLEKESYARRLEGIDAWHRSEVNKFYRLLGQESMGSEKSVDDIISERIAQNKPTLSSEEFNSVMELNRRLRY